MQLEKVLYEYFGYESFRPGQKEIITAIIEKQDVLAVMPTGAGKSLCYQIPALLSQSFSIVISPLISLMKNQVDNLNVKNKISGFINSSLDFREIENVFNEISRKEIKLLYISPEKLENIEFVKRIKSLEPEYLFIDEAHCISEWGHNFRPSYRKISFFKNYIGFRNISAFTATATPQVREDIISQLEMKNQKVFVYGFERENISLNVIKTNRKRDQLPKILKEENLPAIIYTATRKKSEAVADFLRYHKIDCRFYHAGLTPELRRVIQDDFLSGRTKIIVATSAFGMGIDKKDVRCVIHYDVPGTIENFYQEFGRAGRDGMDAETYLLFDAKDIKIQEHFINSAHPTKEQIRFVYDALANSAKIAVGTTTDKKIPLDKNFMNVMRSEKISRGLLSSAISILEEAGYVKHTSDYEQNHFVKILYDKTDLRKYIDSLHNNLLKDLILLIIRDLGETVFRNPTKINPATFSATLNIQENQLVKNLEFLDSLGLLLYEKPSGYSNVQLTTDRVLAKNLRIDYEKISQMREFELTKLDAVVNYVNTSGCRFKYILDYFGEDTENYSCGKCDNCKGLNHQTGIQTDFIKEAIIQTLTENSGKIKQSRLIQILTGKTAVSAARKFSTFGRCSHYSKQEIFSAVDELKLSHKVIADNDYLTLSGTLLFDDNGNSIDSANINADYENHLLLFNKLREQRKLTAQKYGQTSALICPDYLLKEIAKKKPTTPSEILSIKGFTGRMYNKVGEDFLLIIKDHIQNEKQKETKEKLPENLIQTQELIKKGYKLEDIAKILKLPSSLVALQIESIVEFEPDENYLTLFPEEELKLIDSVVKSGVSEIQELKEKLPNSISYPKLRLFLTLERVKNTVEKS